MPDTLRSPPARRPGRSGGIVTHTLFSAVVSLSLLLWLAMACLWARSYWRWDCYRIHSSGASDYHLTFDTGRLTLNVTTDDLWSYHPYARAHRRVGGPRYATGPAPLDTFRPGRSVWNRLGFCDFTFVNAGNAFETSWRTISVPLWFPTLLAAALPAGWLVHFRRMRFKAGHCRRCGYDLRATPDRCPECGEAAAVFH